MEEDEENVEKRIRSHNGKVDQIEIYSLPSLTIQDGKAGVIIYNLSAQRYIYMFSLQITVAKLAVCK